MPYSAEKRAQLRYEALVGISKGKSPRCICCGERRVWALCFDHINGGGTAHRRNNAKNPTVALVRRTYKITGKWDTNTYQILCATCNHGRRISGSLCPHKKEVLYMTYQIIEALKSYVKVFLATVLSLFLADGADVFAVTFADVRTWLAAAIASILPLIITALDPNDTRFGVNS
jgi:hypothetical protein